MDILRNVDRNLDRPDHGRCLVGKTNASIRSARYIFGRRLQKVTRTGSLRVSVQNRSKDAASGMESIVAKR